MKLEDIRLTQMDSPDLKGLQWVNEKEGTTVSYRPEFFPIENVPGIIFLDEITAAEPRMQATSYQLILDRRIGPHVLPDKWMVIGAGNAPEDGAISYKMGSALADRFVHIQVEANANDWITWAVENEIHPSVLTFIKVKPDFLNSVQGQTKSSQLISPSPRSWARVSQIMQHVDNKVCNSILINGVIGDATAVEFIHTMEEISELPSMETLLTYKSPKDAIKLIPKKMACLYGLAYSLASYVKTEQHINRALLLFDALQSLSDTNLPIAEIETLANEMLLDKAVKFGIIQNIVTGEPYKKYAPRAKQIANT